MVASVAAGRTGRPRKLPGDRVIKTAISLPPEVLEWLDRECGASGDSRSSAVRRLIRFCMEHDIALSDITSILSAVEASDRRAVA